MIKLIVTFFETLSLIGGVYMMIHPAPHLGTLPGGIMLACYITFTRISKDIK